MRPRHIQYASLNGCVLNRESIVLPHTLGKPTYKTTLQDHLIKEGITMLLPVPPSMTVHSAFLCGGTTIHSHWTANLCRTLPYVAIGVHSSIPDTL